ncbi:NADPH-dependent 7-cyano-7-deazaguanine reductase QueF [Nitrogeniibacter mangrovi]|uniref:NADPH-dependent 7-cyano-7-deazaguanine reductase n=1 Tax=Nitrogeniibacter mangrovi TaxID=2016596 RepID=A0A6C1B0U8_9RHOO|nr:NADPH-dependent 7-cyano-7-deazaguanine reductase QueF [Nitrogeniibacter mangrovi]QID16525.1 NADPH-dependent 7-cyano-7-deazaguanine reductase QueF [Nitrogeniibacter mangrovi]
MTDPTVPHGAEASPLGQASRYRNTYAPELLFPVPRAAKRAEIGIDAAALPFVGEDVWNAYELSWLNPRGKPVVAMGVFRVPAESPSLIESKSLKLYLNSFNGTACESMAAVEARIARDLSVAAGAPVRVSLQALDAVTREVATLPGECIDDLDIDVRDYRPAPQHLRADARAGEVSETLYSHLLKSNCLVTGQPDWATLYVRYSGAPIDRAGLLRYVVSFREHNEFHEQCVERVFVDLMRQCRPRELAVWARYTRRGGLDINPFRSHAPMASPPNGGDPRQ